MFKENNCLNEDSIIAKKETGKLLDKDSSNKEEATLKATENFYNLKSNEELNAIWDEKYDQEPTLFFDDQNFKYLSSLGAGERLNLMAIAATSIMVTPQMAEKYFAEFKDDLLVVDKIFELSKFEGLNRRNYHLFTICALQMDKKGLKAENYNDTYVQYTGDLEQFYNIARRRNEAPKYLLSNFSDKPIREDFAEFGPATDGLIETIKSANNHNSKLDTSKMFSGEFKNLSEDKKSLFLRKCLSKFQYSLLFDETFNSNFTAESDEYFSKHINNQHNVTHSMIFKSYQPAFVYNYNQEYFESSMDWTEEIGGYVEEHADYKMILATLDEIKNATEDKDENTKLVVEFWNKNRNPVFTEAVSKALSGQNVDLAASELLELLKTEKDKKEPINAMLYRLEFGKIGISEEGVKYLEKVYDLGTYNNSDFHASRLTVNGEIGIFNEELELIKYFHLGRLDSEEKRMKADVLDFTYDTLFIGGKNESPEERERRESYLEEFKKKYYQISEDEIFKSTGVQLNNLSFKEQGWFLIYFNRADKDEKEQLRSFVAKYQENGIKAFLSMETDQKLGQKIIALGEKLDRDSGKIVFNRIAEIITLAEKENDELKTLFLKDEDGADFDWREVRLTLLRKTEILISNFYKGTETEPNQKEINDLLDNLTNSRSELLLLSAVLKSAKENKQKINLDIVRDLDLEKRVIGREPEEGLSNQEKEQMVKIAEENYQKIFLEKGKSYNPEAYNRVIADFNKELENLDNQIVFILKYKGAIICSNRFKPISEHEVYGASFNVLKDIQGLLIGENFMEMTGEEISKKYDIKIKSRKDNPANNSYERKGFIIIGEHTEKDGVEYYEMIKPAKLNFEGAA